MFGLKKGRNQNIVMLLAVAALIFLLFQMNSKSGYAIVEREYSAFGAAPAAGPAAAPATPAASVTSALTWGWPFAIASPPGWWGCWATWGILVFECMPSCCAHNASWIHTHWC